MRLNSKISEPKTGITSRTDQIQLMCARAKELEEAGEYEAARAELSDFWRRIGDRPEVTGLSALAQAEVYLRSGTLSGWIGSARQVPGAQETAKDLITAAARIFDDCGLPERVAEARVDLGICYWREGAFDEAWVTLNEALQVLGGMESEQRLRALLNRACVERASNRYDDALRTHREAAPLFEPSTNHTLKGKFHSEYATVLKNVGVARSSDDFIDRALVEFAAATFHAEQAGNKRFLAQVENNLGYLFVQLGRFSEAHTHLNRARALFTTLKDKGLVAQVDDTRARAFIAEGILTRGETLARGSVKALEEGDELSVLAEALTTHATALARMGNFAKARVTLERAIRTAHTAGDPESGGVAALTMVEELTSHLSFNDLLSYYRIAESELTSSQHPDIQTRLGRGARLLLKMEPTPAPQEDLRIGSEAQATTQAGIEASVSEASPSLEEQVLQYESNLIRQALEAAEGSVTRAARQLGITHQGLAFILNGRHKDLLVARRPVKRRRRSIIRFH